MDFLQHVAGPLYDTIVFEYKRWLEEQVDYYERLSTKKKQNHVLNVIEGFDSNFKVEREEKLISKYRRFLKDIERVQNKKTSWKKLYQESLERSTINIIVAYVHRNLPKETLLLIDKEVERTKGLFGNN